MSQSIDARIPSCAVAPVVKNCLLSSMGTLFLHTIVMHRMGKIHKKAAWFTSLMLGMSSLLLFTLPTKKPSTDPSRKEEHDSDDLSLIPSEETEDDLEPITSHDFGSQRLSAKQLSEALQVMPHLTKLYFRKQLSKLGDNIPDRLLELHANGCKIEASDAEQLILQFQGRTDEKGKKLLAFAREICTSLEPSEHWTEELLVEELPHLKNVDSIYISQDFESLFTSRVWELLKTRKLKTIGFDTPSSLKSIAPLQDLDVKEIVISTTAQGMKEFIRRTRENSAL